jgi:hypothetical protein
MVSRYASLIISKRAEYVGLGTPEYPNCNVWCSSASMTALSLALMLAAVLATLFF